MRSPITRIDIMDDAMVHVMRQKSPAERLAVANAMWCFARDMIRQIVLREHPDWTEEQICREVARRLSHGAV